VLTQHLDDDDDGDGGGGGCDDDDDDDNVVNKKQQFNLQRQKLPNNKNRPQQNYL
jgi:hypothetical protein